MITVSQPGLMERGAYRLVGVYRPIDGENEGAVMEAAYLAFRERQAEISNRTDDLIHGFYYWPHQDDPTAPEGLRTWFIGVEVSDLAHVPPGMATTQFSAGKYAAVECSHTQPEEDNGLGEAMGMLETWIPAQGFVKGGACFSCSHEQAVPPPYVEMLVQQVETGA